MMTMMLRVVLIVVSVITMTFMMRKIRQAKVQIEAAMFWVIMALILVVFAVVPGAADLCCKVVRHLFHTKLSVPVYDLFADRKGIWYDHPVVPA